MKKINIAMDGPSAAGKSTVADILAEKLGYIHLDTGAMYRCVALKALREGIALDDAEALKEMLSRTDIRQDTEKHFFLDGEDVSKAIREDHISMATSDVSKVGVVREDLVRRQQKLAEEKGYIVDGRDIGTVVLKDAEVKIYLTASAHARALRRLKQNQENGISTSDLETIEKEIEARDYQDMHREISPLTKAEDAVEIDSSDLTIDEVVDRAYALAAKFLE
ncbi:MAG: (d)CMP kinase [Erysipelotrichaceae bacterium]|nr:(d)CMP kinase [Solobacterium sp.]MCR5449189.1 (d)CMP kinase [Solobacterium sp.]MDO4192750.1 (d)CMP kinase [Erysipelotrichaceae bacterium]MDO5121135.1 (d)CMP kinase [Erysipelotrichaceae bacterium]